jgi:hypothetical protein
LDGIGVRMLFDLFGFNWVFWIGLTDGIFILFLGDDWELR